MRVFIYFLKIFPFLFITTSANAFEIGIGTHLSQYKDAPESYVALAQKGGFTSIRDGVIWNAVNISHGEITGVSQAYSKLDNVLLGNKGISDNALLFLGYGNKSDTDNSYPKSPSEIDLFSIYAKAIAKRYKGKVKYYEIWNEWLMGTGVPLKNEIPGPAVYIELVRKASTAIKSVDPDAIVMASSINPFTKRDVTWLNILIDHGLLNYVDGISIHPYTYKSKQLKLRDAVASLQMLDIFEQNLRNKVGHSVDLYITEMGIPTSRLVVGGTSSADAAINVIKYTTAVRTRDYIKGIWWYDLIDDGNSPFNSEHNFGFLMNNKKPKPAFNSLSRYSKEILDRKLKIDEKTGKVYRVNSQGEKEVPASEFNK